MKTAVAHLKSVSPYSQSKYISAKKPRDQTHADFEQEHWRERMHVDSSGICFDADSKATACKSSLSAFN